MRELWRLLRGRHSSTPTPTPVQAVVVKSVVGRQATFKRKRPRWTDAHNRPE